MQTMGEVPRSGQIETSMGVASMSFWWRFDGRPAKREPENVRMDEVEATWCGYTLD